MFQKIAQNLRDLPGAMTISSASSGLLAVIVGYASSVVILIQAANNSGLDRAHLSSWILAVTVGSGLCSLWLSLRYRQPIIGAWSTPGAALLVTSLAQYHYSDAVGAFLISGLAITLLGYSRLFGRVMSRIPQPVVMGMLGGILIKFGFNIFTALPERPVMVIAMLVVFFALRRVGFRAPTVGALVVGVLIAAVSQDIHLQGFVPSLAVPIFTAPTFSLEALLGLSLPLFALALTSQNAPGQAVLQAAGYEPPIDDALVVTGIGSVLGAPFGGHGLTLAAITAAIVVGPEAHPDKDKRYSAAVSVGIWYVILGIFGATVVALFAGLPAALIAVVSGLGVMSALISSTSGAMIDPNGREGGIVALLCTAANFTLFGIGAPFWGLVFGVGVHLLMRWRISPQE